MRWFFYALSWRSKQREKKKNIRVYISSAKNEKRANNALHKWERERNRRFLGKKSRTWRVYAGEKAAGWVSFGGIIFLDKGRETTHQKGRKMIECFPEKERKQEREREMSKLWMWEKCSAGKFFHFDFGLCIVPALNAVFCERGRTLAHYIYIYIYIRDEQTLSFSLSLSLSF